MNRESLYQRYQSLQSYVGWEVDDARRIASIAERIQPRIELLVDDFYTELEKHPDARKVMTGGADQIIRLKQALTMWLRELLSGVYDVEYVVRRWRVGYRHVEIGLEQVYTNVAMSRLRTGLQHGIEDLVTHGLLEAAESYAVARSLNKLLDLDLAIIESAYQTEYSRRQEQTEKLATIGQVAGGVAHELRNPLNVIQTSVYYLLHARNASTDKRTEHLKRIERQVGLADNVITALSNFARLPVPALQAVALQQWIPGVLETIETPEYIEVVVEHLASIPHILMDPQQMPIVLRNLIANACDAMPDGGQVRVFATHEHEQVALRIVDEGTGIAPEDLLRMMEPLFTTKARGIGLGLAISKAIVEKNNGQLSAKSDPGLGTTMTICLQACTGN